MLKMTHRARFFGRLLPFSWIASHWRHEWRWYVNRALFERRHYRRLIPLVALGFLAVIWSFLVLGLGLLLGGAQLIWQRAFVQNVVASLLVLPISLAIGVFVATLVQKHSLRFQVRHAGDRMRDCVGHGTFKFIIFLKTVCGLPIDLEGPVNHRLVLRARSTAHRSFVASSWSLALPPDFQLRLNETVDDLSSCFRRSADLRIAFPRSFDLMEELESLVADIRAGGSRSTPDNTALIVLHYAAEILQDLA